MQKQKPRVDCSSDQAKIPRAKLAALAKNFRRVLINEHGCPRSEVNRWIHNMIQAGHDDRAIEPKRLKTDD